jgi:uncharacterized membrane protein YoaK (UPF0700 family)
MPVGADYSLLFQYVSADADGLRRTANVRALVAGALKSPALWLLRTRAPPLFVFVIASVQRRGICQHRGYPMKKVLFALVATLVAVSVSGCVGVGKGKAPPPIVTKG